MTFAPHRCPVPFVAPSRIVAAPLPVRTCPGCRRLGHGRFSEGNRGGPGNPFARKVAELRQAFLEAVSAQDIKEIALVVRAKAQSGDLAAVKILLQYGLGKPEPVKDPDRMDVDEW